MLILGIDTSTEIGAIGLVDKTGLLGEINIRLSHRHSESLLTNIDFLLHESGFRMKELEGLSITVGPGSFTGLRIGLSTVKTFAQVLNIPIIGLSTLDVLAYSLFQQKGWLVPIIDAKRERVYTSLYHNWKQDIKKVKEWKEEAISVNELLERLSKLDADGSFFLIGDGVSAYREIFLQSGLNLFFPPLVFNLPKGGVVAELGQFYLEQGFEDDLINLSPNYLKLPQAEINWLKKYKRSK